MKKYLLGLSLFSLLASLPVLAQPPSWVVKTPDGQTLQGSDDEKMLTLLSEFLRGKQDGKLVLTMGRSGRSRSIEFFKKGQRVSLTADGKSAGTEEASRVLANFIAARDQGRLTGCKANIKNIATGLEMWATDHKGSYPDKLVQITPAYLKVMPTCPACRKDSYSATYHKAGTHYSFACSGGHLASPPGHPCYDSENGLQP